MKQGSAATWTGISATRYYIARLREALWFRPLISCLLSIAAAFIANLAEQIEFIHSLPDVSAESIEKLLTTIASSMLAISVFAVGSMISAYASASNGATPRSFALVVSDDVSQNALSTFIGAFIFSIVALVALLNDFYTQSGRFVLFLLTLFVFGLVILGFVRWVDRIARLGRLGNTVEKVENATETAMKRHIYFCRKSITRPEDKGEAVYSNRVGYVQHIDFTKLQCLAEELDLRISIDMLPGSLSTPDRPLVFISGHCDENRDTLQKRVDSAFVINRQRTFESDPRFGLIVLSQIASRALSPAVNDEGTAIDILSVFLRLFAHYQRTKDEDGSPKVEYDRLSIPGLSIDEMFDDAFNSLARDGAYSVTVAMRHQKALYSLASLGDQAMSDAAKRHATLALEHARKQLKLESEIGTLEALYAENFPTAEATAR
ncbi:DUF2254 domain-containing protein [Marinobacterium lutimaris]|uniref:Uncharacterized membrane protein n=1 Tax=Marinobacterium lutimaris TaxID=568106 RepID=A0A1H5ZFH5_9GAMM|nr:DUF2254 domain-containing protein [Marinobacterium lutimaris]SEG35032.1 Uncharacterized membrane protein [Marinobacterium lutimaris]